MKEKVKKILSVVVLLTALISMCVVSVAATDFDDDQNLETDLDYSEDTTYSMLRGNNLNFGTTSVKKWPAIRLPYLVSHNVIMLVIRYI